jgi:NADH-quinone oxidoreductase subunit H
LLGSVRASAQLLSYEAAFGLSVLAVLMQANTLSTRDIATQQAWIGGNGFGDLRDWPIWNWYFLPTLFVPLLIFLVAATAETNHPPFDLVEAEQELVGGFFTEYAGVRFALFYLAEFMNTITISAVAVTLFFGGPSGPVYSFLPESLWPILWFFLKLLVFLFCYVWLRASVPRFRYDQLMDIGWKRLTPAALYWLLLIAAIQMGRDEDWHPAVVLAVGVLAGLAVIGSLALAMRTSRMRVDDEAPSLKVGR